MSRGDFSALAPISLQLRQFPGFAGMSEAMDAASGISPARAAQVAREREHALLGDLLNFPSVELAQPLGIERLPSSFRAPVQSDVPTLFLSGTLDGRTYVESHRETARGFSTATHVIIEGAGHDLFMSSPQVERRILDFLARGVTSSEPIDVPRVGFTLPGV